MKTLLYSLVGLVILGFILWLIFADGMPSTSIPTIDTATSTYTTIPIAS